MTIIRKNTAAMICVAMMLGGCATTAGHHQTAPASIGDLTAKSRSMQAHRGFITFYWDEKQGKVWLEIDQFDQEFIYVNYLARGVGSNDLGLDRGQIGNTRIVKFQRVGPRVLLVQPNYEYRALTDNEAERRAIEESFASSALWAFTVAHEGGGKVLVDATAFLARDAHGLAHQLGRAKEGKYAVDAERSVFFAPRSRAFENNTEIEFAVTFTGEPDGQYLPQVTPTPQALTVHMHHSFVALPDDDFRPRAFDPRSGYFGISFGDYATPIDAPLIKRFIARHRLQKKDPSATVSDAVKPIVYYVDAGAPPLIREALIEGARWWAAAFEAIGYKDAFQVEVLPPGVDPLDVRYNVIQWVHRATRGWSYGASVIDPRTGEIIKGHVSLGSLRVRQDFLLAEGLLAPYTDSAGPPTAAQEMALARLRQLSAHEVGHTLGLDHNFAASVQDRASVMDYPHPLVTIGPDDRLDISEAYATGIGAWDRFAIEYGYQEFADGQREAAGLAVIVARSIKRGQLYMADPDARPAGAAHPLAHLWDNGTDAVAELQRLMRVRARVLARFSENNIPLGAPMATLEEVLVPMYLMHRYQAEATAKLLGGQFYTYALRGDGQAVTRTVSGTSQRAALTALLDTLAPGALLLPDGLAAMIPARPPGYFAWHNPELFARRTGPVFDTFSPAESAAAMIVGLILQPQRANRLVNFHALDPSQPGLDSVFKQLVAASWQQQRQSGAAGSIQEIVDHAVLDGIMRLASDPVAGERVREKAYASLDELSTFIDRHLARHGQSSAADHYRYGKLRIQRFILDPTRYPPPPPPTMPAGSPIGAGTMGGLFPQH